EERGDARAATSTRFACETWAAAGSAARPVRSMRVVAVRRVHEVGGPAVSAGSAAAGLSRGSAAAVGGDEAVPRERAARGRARAAFPTRSVGSAPRFAGLGAVGGGVEEPSPLLDERLSVVPPFVDSARSAVAAHLAVVTGFSG